MERFGGNTAFFTVLVGNFSEKLKMPNDFVGNYTGSALCKLHGPTGKLWDVKLEEGNNAIFFHKGWKKFVMENILDEGNFLVFNYDGDSCFKVTIYDESFCEMDMETAKRNVLVWLRDDFPGIEAAGETSSSSSSSIDISFPKLKTLSIESMSSWYPCASLEEKSEKITIMPCLSQLSIKECEDLKEPLPDFLWKTPLQTLHIADSPFLANLYREGVGEHWSKISHIPTINISYENLSTSARTSRASSSSSCNTAMPCLMVYHTFYLGVVGSVQA